jgi:hypothetical protein
VSAPAASAGASDGSSMYRAATVARPSGGISNLQCVIRTLRRAGRQFESSTVWDAPVTALSPGIAAPNVIASVAIDASVLAPDASCQATSPHISEQEQSIDATMPTAGAKVVAKAVDRGPSPRLRDEPPNAHHARLLASCSET